MKNSMVKGLIVYMILFYVISFAAFIGYSYFTFSASSFLPIYRSITIFNKAFQLFLLYLPAAQFSAVLMAASFSQGASAAGDGNDVFRMLGQVILVLLAFTFLQTLLKEAVYPSSAARLSYLERKSELARQLLTRAREARTKHDFDIAAVLYSEYLVIDSGNQQIKDEQSLNLRERYLNTPAANGSRTGQPDTGGLMNAGLEQLTGRAGDFLSKEDYYSALYYADLALKLDPSFAEALKLKKEAEKNIAQAAPAESETKKTDYYFQKKEGYEALFQFNNPVRAFYIYQDLKSSHPDDRDVIRYFAEAEKKLLENSFFMDEASFLSGHLFYSDIVFANVLSENYTELIFAEKLYSTPAAVYLESVEVMRWASDGRVLYHLTSPLAKLHDSRMLLTAYHREDSSLAQKPRVIAGTFEYDPAFLELFINPDSLWMFSSDLEDRRMLSIPTLNKMRKEFPRYGLAGIDAEIELADRILAPFSLFMLSLVFFYLGMKGKVKEKIKLVPALLSIPVFYYTLFNLSDSFSLFLKTMAAGLLTAMSLGVVLLLGIAFHAVVMGVFLFISLRHV